MALQWHRCWFSLHPSTNRVQRSGLLAVEEVQVEAVDETQAMAEAGQLGEPEDAPLVVMVK